MQHHETELTIAARGLAHMLAAELEAFTDDEELPRLAPHLGRLEAVERALVAAGLPPLDAHVQRLMGKVSRAILIRPHGVCPLCGEAVPVELTQEHECEETACPPAGFPVKYDS